MRKIASNEGRPYPFFAILNWTEILIQPSYFSEKDMEEIDLVQISGVRLVARHF